MRTKIAAALLAMLLALTGLAGCSGGGKTSSAPKSTDAKGESTAQNATGGDTDVTQDPAATQTDEQGEPITGPNVDPNTSQGDGNGEPGKTNGSGGSSGKTNHGSTPGDSATKTGSGNASATTSSGGTASTASPTEPAFRLNVTGLKKKTVYLIDKSLTAQAPKGMMAHDTLRLVCSLQGLLNRDFKTNQIAMYITYEDADTFWYQQMRGSGGILSGYAEVKITSFNQFLETFKNQLVSCGMIAWDPSVPATANAAATICGLDGYLPVKYDESGSGLMAKLKDMGVKVKMNLVNRFTGKGIITGTKIASTGSTKCDTYLWLMDKYLDRCSKEMIAYMPDGAGCVATNDIYIKDGDASPYGNNLLDHDYLIANRCFFFDLSPVDSEAPCDDRGQPVGSDHKTLRRILQAQYDRNKGKFSKVIGFPPWWIKYTTHNSWGALPATTVEWLFTDIATQYNLAKEADAAHPCCTANASLYENVPLNSSFKNTNRKTMVTEKFDKNTIYMLYYMGDYDSSAWLKRWVPVIWQDSGKGSMPMMWSFNPNLSDRVPMVFNYIYTHMDSQDYFVSGDSGPGYIIPGGLYKSMCPDRPNPDGAGAWAAYSKPYMQKFDMDIVGFIINGNYKMNTTIMKLYNQFAPTGSFHNDPSKPLYVVDGTPYVYLKNGVGNPGSYASSAEGMYSYLKTTMGSVNFGAFRTINWTPSQIKALSDAFLAYARKKDPGKTYKFVDPYTYFAMIKQSGQGVKG